jgi:hypothetical protein
MADPTQIPVTPGAKIPVIPKTAGQQKRSAAYTWLVGIGIALPGVLSLVHELAPDLQKLFPRHAEMIGALSSIAAGVGAMLLASQRGGSVKDATAANYTEPPADGGAQ